MGAVGSVRRTTLNLQDLSSLLTTHIHCLSTHLPTTHTILPPTPYNHSQPLTPPSHPHLPTPHTTLPPTPPKPLHHPYTHTSQPLTTPTPTPPNPSHHPPTHTSHPLQVAMMLESTYFAVHSCFRALLGVVEHFSSMRCVFAVRRLC